MDVTTRIICISLLVSLICTSLVESFQGNSFVDTVPDLIESDGYPFESHFVKTKDNFILNLFRIPHGRNDIESSTYEGRRPVAFLGTCLHCSSASYVMLGPENSLAYMLANDGYDVWLINVRGSKYSRKHTKFSTKSRKFWDFSVHEHGVYDLPASIDYILKVTQVPQVDYVGFSMGTTMVFILLSEKPDYNKKIRIVVAMAPSAYQQYTRGIIPLKTKFSPVLQKYSENTGRAEWPLPDADISETLKASCKPRKHRISRFCKQMVNMAGSNIDNGNTDLDRISYYFKFFPDPTSIKNIVHYEQLKGTDKFSKFDYGRRRNYRRYGSRKPPEYDLGRITVPVHLIYARKDFITTKKDALHSSNSLGNVASRHEVRDKNFAHLDFSWGINTPIQAYKIVLEKLGRNATRSSTQFMCNKFHRSRLQ